MADGTPPEGLIIDRPHGAEDTVQVIVFMLKQFGKPVFHLPFPGLPMFVQVINGDRTVPV